MTSLATIAPPPAQALRSNLIRAARPDPADGARWETSGVTYQPLQHGDFDDIDDFGLFDPCAVADVDIQDAPGPVEFKTHGLWVAAKCSGMSGGADVFDDVQARARQRLGVQESHLLERALWTGGAVDSPALAGVTADITQPLGTTPTGIVKAFSALIDSLADVVGGERAFIHVPAALGPYLARYDLAAVAANGQTILTAVNDHVIVLGTGYEGTGPAADAESDPAPADADALWVYATTAVEVRLGPVTVTNDPAEMLDKTNNDIVAIAQRPAIAHWDRQAHIGVQVALPDLESATGS